MFGNAPRELWSRWIVPDDHNRIPLACRCLLVRTDDGRHVLLETGIGAFFEPKLAKRYGVESTRHELLEALARGGLQPDDIDGIILSHLHFDHAGGLLSAWEEGRPHRLAFPRATVYVGAGAWERARAPHPRDRASFIDDLPELLEATGRLEIVHGSHHPALGNGFRFSYSDGHTPGMMLTTVDSPRGPMTFMGDLVPGLAWVHLPITMGYDRFPELVIDEKRELLERIRADDGWMFFTHDPTVSAAQVRIDERGRYSGTEPTAELRWS